MQFVTSTELKSKHNYCLGITQWKRGIFNAYLGGRSNCTYMPRKQFRTAFEKAKKHDGRVISWASSTPENLPIFAKSMGVELILVEDGFIRSSGLGIKLFHPGSLCFSHFGIHYDPTQPNDLCEFMKSHTFTPEEEARGQEIIEAITSRGISKYNADKGDATTGWPTPSGEHNGSKKILIIGQVGDDASLRKGRGNVGSNDELVNQVRIDNPDASIIYRPHPDVTSKLREGRVDTSWLSKLDIIPVEHGNLIDLIDLADEVHVVSSQTGLEALLRGAHVVCHGRPFYAGWGLTEDVHGREDLESAKPKLSLAQLAYAVYDAYPIYVDPFTREECDVFHMMELVQTSKDWPRPHPICLTGVWLKRYKRRLFGLGG